MKGSSLANLHLALRSSIIRVAVPARRALLTLFPFGRQAWTAAVGPRLRHLRLQSRCIAIGLFCGFFCSIGSEARCGEPAWVAVGYGGRRIISFDIGKTWAITQEWSQPGKDDANNLMSLTHAQGKFIAVGGGGGGRTGGGHVLISSNGKDWREVWSPPNRVNPIVFGNDRFIVGAPRRQLYYSHDAETWTAGARLDDKRCTHFRQGAFGNGVFVITGNKGGNSPAWVCTTKDGMTVENFTFDIPNIRGLVYGNEQFVIVGQGVRITSKDGVTWDSTGLPEAERLTWVIYVPGSDASERGYFLCGGGSKVYRSADGAEWHEDARRFRGQPKWTDGQNFIATGWPGKMFYSHDGGHTWGEANPLTANGINRVTMGIVE